MKLKLQNENLDQQQEKHDAYLKAGFKLKSTRKSKDLVIRKYQK